jgi:hypothetical protein
MIYLRYLKRLIFESPGKSITLAVTILAFCYAGTFDYKTETKTIFGQNMLVEGHDTTHTYLYKSEGNITCVSFRKALEVLPGNIIVYQESNGLNALMWGIFILGFIILGFGTFGDSQVNWEFKQNWHDTLYNEIRVVEDEGKYNWVLRNRLIFSSQNATDGHSLRIKVDDYIDNKEIYPEFRTKQEKRNRKLDKIGIS